MLLVISAVVKLVCAVEVDLLSQIFGTGYLTPTAYFCSNSPAYPSSSLATWTELPSVAGGALLEYVVSFTLKRIQSMCFRTANGCPPW